MPSLKQHQFRPIAVEIEETPLPLWEWLTLSTIVISVVSAIAFLYLGQVDIVVSAHGKVVPRGQILVVKPLETGVVKSIAVKPGDFVRQGQLLMEIEPDLTEPELLSAKRELDNIGIQRQRIMSLVTEAEFEPSKSECSPEQVALERTLYRTERDALEQKLRTKESERAQTVKQLAAQEREKLESESLLKIAQEKWEKVAAVEGLLASKDIDPVKEELTRYESERDKADSRIAELNHKLSEIDSEKLEFRQEFNKRLLAELDANKQQEVELSARLREHGFRTNLQRVLAPADGTINERFVNTVGGVVSAAEKLMTIVPKNEPLIIEALAENRDVGFIKAGMKSSIKVDTFDYQRYGLLQGSVKDVASDSIKDEKLGEVFVVRVVPEKTSLMVDGKETPINSGMTVDAEIKVGKRRMIEFFLNPILKSWQHSVSLK